MNTQRITDQHLNASEPRPQHDLFACEDCREEAEKVQEAVVRIKKWAGAFVRLRKTPLSADLREVLTDVISTAIFMEADLLEGEIPRRMLCSEEMDRLGDGYIREVDLQAVAGDPKA